MYLNMYYNKSIMNLTYIIMTVAAVSVIIGSAIGANSVQHSWRLESAKTSCAQFNPVHGQFEWLEKADD